MNAASLPAALTLLRDERNLAVGPAVVEALPDMTPSAQSAAVQLLAARDDRAGLAGIVGRFREYDESLQATLITLSDALFAGVGPAMASSSFASRRSAVDYIAASHATRLTYLLSESLRGKCPRTRELAADVLKRMTGRHLDLVRQLSEGAIRANEAAPRDHIHSLALQEDDLADALRKAVASWEMHVQFSALEAALWLPDRVEEVVRAKLEAPRGHFANALNELLEGTTDPNLAAFALRALTLPQARSTAARTISRAQTAAFQKAVLRESWVLGDPIVQSGCRRIRESPWLHENAETLAAMPDEWASRVVRLLMASGGSSERKYDRLKDLINSCRESYQRAALWHLLKDESESGAALLKLLAQRGVAEVAAIARRECNEREKRGEHALEAVSTSEADPNSMSVRFGEFWKQRRQLPSEEWLRKFRSLPIDGGGLLIQLRAKLASNSADDRSGALAIVDAVGLTEPLAEQLYRLANDPDAHVRSQVVRMLASLGTATGLRVLRGAVNDGDERVQANAIEALDLLNAEDRLEYTRPKLESKNARVRANAVKSLLRLDLRKAAEVLMDMLADHDRSHRLSALWVVERLRLRSLLDRVIEIGRHDPDERVRQRAGRLLRTLANQQAAASHRTTVGPASRPAVVHPGTEP